MATNQSLPYCTVCSEHCSNLGEHVMSKHTHYDHRFICEVCPRYTTYDIASLFVHMLIVHRFTDYELKQMVCISVGICNV